MFSPLLLVFHSYTLRCSTLGTVEYHSGSETLPQDAGNCSSPCAVGGTSPPDILHKNLDTRWNEFLDSYAYSHGPINASDKFF
ncbi:hypothetical protein F5X96DRAFT_641864 [Biscogniauxia mediterranea]|nr:hypothetical protein F5X96DRAFT_641864 [Biscogniauxia mediterranea]